MSLIEMIRKHLSQDEYEIVNEFILYKSCDADQDCLIVKHKNTGVQYKISVEEWGEDD